MRIRADFFGAHGRDTVGPDVGGKRLCQRRRRPLLGRRGDSTRPGAKDGDGVPLLSLPVRDAGRRRRRSGRRSDGMRPGAEDGDGVPLISLPVRDAGRTQRLPG